MRNITVTALHAALQYSHISSCFSDVNLSPLESILPFSLNYLFLQCEFLITSYFLHFAPLRHFTSCETIKESTNSPKFTI